MNEIVNQLAQSLFKKNSLQECSRWELEILADHYPYFGIAQFMVTGKLKDDHAEDYDKQLEKTSLYFTNPLWLDYLINNKETTPVTVRRDKDIAVTRHTEEIVIPEEAVAVPVAAAMIGTQEAPIVEEAATDHYKESFSIFNTPSSDQVPIESTIIEVREHIDHNVADTPLEEHSYNESTSIFNIPSADGLPVQAIPEHIELPIVEATPLMSTANVDQEPGQSTTEPVQPEIDKADEAAAEELDNTDYVETANNSVPDEPEFKMKAFKFDPVQDTNLNAPLSFEPYHTVDYFASQGIKVVQQEKPKDERFDKQLKSFTQWLKTIKKVPVAEIAKEFAVDSEQKVITLAEHSIEDREVVTEAMAEVWVKQGNREKAIDVYHKLSLQIPAKSAYFAGLIDHLK